MRVIAIESADKDEVRIFGYGEYVGDFPIPDEIEIKGGLCFAGISSPKIRLEDGTEVWGCQCWWGNAERFEKEKLRGRKVVVVPNPNA